MPAPDEPSSSTKPWSDVDSENGSPSFRVEQPAFHLHSWFAEEGGGHLVTHQVPIGEFDGPHPFFAGDGRLL